MVFPTAAIDPELPRHPTQIYEAAFHLFMAAVLLVLMRGERFRGQLVKLYMLCYVVYRFVTEFIRPESKLLFHLTGYQWAAFALIPLFIWLWIRDHRQFALEAANTET